ncbi:MAG: type II toxin-antitoxin system RelE family toxin [Pseudonocardiaceae bacterium]
MSRKPSTAEPRLADDPRPAGAAAVKSMPGHLRLRVGHYRVIYEVQDHKLVVLIVELGHRREVYR